MTTWTHLIFEAFCGFIEESEYLYEVITFKPFKTKKIKNKKYDPEKIEKRPEWCPLNPCYTCHENKCEWLILSPVEKEEYDIMIESWEKMGKDNINKDNTI